MSLSKVSSLAGADHFIISEMEFDEEGNVVRCVIEAVMTKRERELDWHDLKDTQQWRQGWK